MFRHEAELLLPTLAWPRNRPDHKVTTLHGDLHFITKLCLFNKLLRDANTA
jgi:hypothetical protein